MRCPACGHGEDKVIDSRSTKEGRAIRRRRECQGCGHRYTTYEYVENASFMVVKKDGKREPFNREKIFQGIAKACEKRPIAPAVLEELVDRIELDLQRSVPGEVTSRQVGERVMEELQKLDEVAYVRFASVYRHFKDLNQFLEELRSFLK